jgi:hypothetical protein
VHAKAVPRKLLHPRFHAREKFLEKTLDGIANRTYSFGLPAAGP